MRFYKKNRPLIYLLSIFLLFFSFLFSITPGIKGDIEKTVFPDYAKKGMLNTIKFKNVEWFSVDSFKDMEECTERVEKIIK